MSQRSRSRVFIIAEAGSNWKAGSASADWKRAKALVDVAKDAGADAVKFQVFSANTVYVPNAGQSQYLAGNGIQESIVALFEKMEMPHAMIPKLADYCSKIKIEFMSSFFSHPDFKAVNPFVRRHKIASYEITHPRLLGLAAKSRKPLILSTGAATHDDIAWAIRHFRGMGGRELSLLQCTAKYPAAPEDLNLNVIGDFLRRYKLPVGLSDHSADPLVGPIAAVALGASILEKHFTLSRKLNGPDHAFAVEPHELKQLVLGVRSCEASLGDGRKRILGAEKELYYFAQRAVQAIKEINKGDALREGCNFSILRPGSRKKGMHPRWISKIEGKSSNKRICLGDGIQRRDISALL